MESGKHRLQLLIPLLGDAFLSYTFFRIQPQQFGSHFLIFRLLNHGDFFVMLGLGSSKLRA